jgi:hypothetical protein
LESIPGLHRRLQIRTLNQETSMTHIIHKVSSFLQIIFEIETAEGVMDVKEAPNTTHPLPSLTARLWSVDRSKPQVE